MEVQRVKKREARGRRLAKTRKTEGHEEERERATTARSLNRHHPRPRQADVAIAFDNPQPTFARFNEVRGR